MTDTQADLTERAGAVLMAWMRSRPAGAYQSSIMAAEAIRLIDLYAAFAQSEREAAAAEARKIIRDLVENFGVGGPKANKAFAVATRYLLASPPAPQEDGN